ncbi:cell division protein FtsL [Jeotgalibacillus salarius]|uniref:Cell division protein FtsL n=1 Tax=Jeotgalibacillus salarius TaxID=546023 RepID=A0A4Y8LI53_9BACL|nr:cell division protein FtsL [Jeotgalibacillus salarius]TFE00237.1 cell division protein FtsL [Jeotgalibacillus salarius]
MMNTAKKVEQNPSVQVTQKKVLKKRSSPFTLGEKVIAAVFAAFVCFASLHIITAQAEIYSTNKDIQQLESDVLAQENVNNDLTIQVSQMSTYERVWEKAKELGLTLNDSNVKVVQQP